MDMETFYKVFRREVIQKIEIEENRFGFGPEITAMVATLGVVISEVGISCYGRPTPKEKARLARRFPGPVGDLQVQLPPVMAGDSRKPSVNLRPAVNSLLGRLA